MTVDESSAVKGLIKNIEDQPYIEPPKKGPIKYIAAIFLIVIVSMWIIPTYGVKSDPRPGEILTINEAVNEDIVYPNLVSLSLKEHVIVDYQIKRVADRIVTTACIESSRVCYAKSLFYFVRDNFQYVSDPTYEEYIKTAQESLVTQGGDCDDSSVLLSSLLNSIGIKTRFVFVPGHVYVEAWIPETLSKYKSEDDWVPLDATCHDCGFGEIHYSYADDEKSYINV